MSKKLCIRCGKFEQTGNRLICRRCCQDDARAVRERHSVMELAALHNIDPHLAMLLMHSDGRNFVTAYR